MTASASQPKAGRRERRIIERPRLIKLLDDTDARTILLLAPAGYGKTTLARQWAKTLQGVIWVTLTPGHRDVATLADDIARGLDGLESDSSLVIREHLKARSNPQRAAVKLGEAIAGGLSNSKAQWLVLDDYEEVAGSDEAEELIHIVERRSELRTLIASRKRPQWATGRRLVYGETAEIGRGDLKLTEEEVALVLTRHSNVARIAELAAGWPAAVGLAATVTDAEVPADVLPTSLHRFLAEELFHRAPLQLQNELVTLALLGDVSESALGAQFGADASRIALDASELGFGSGETGFELHPLMREFLLEKLVGDPSANVRVRHAIHANLEAESWDRALELIVRFKQLNEVELAIGVAFKPLARSGRLGTLSAFAESVSPASGFPPPSVEVALAEVAFRDGNFGLATELAERAEPKLGPQHPLASRTAAIIGQVAYLLADFSRAESAFARAMSSAQDDRDETEALHGLALTNVFGEQPTAAESVAALSYRRAESPVDLMRFITADLALRRHGGQQAGLSEPMGLDAARQALSYVDDPRARSSLTYSIAYALSQRADYDEARDWIDLCLDDATTYGLEFAMPYANWIAGHIALGQRRFAEAERALQSVEDSVTRGRDGHHAVNARTLRARLLLQNGDADAAWECLRFDPEVRLIPSWTGEYFATRAIALACLGRVDDAFAAAIQADATTITLEVRLLAQTARAIASLDQGPDDRRSLLAIATRSEIWDPVVCGVRACVGLADLLANDPETRGTLGQLYRRTHDAALARRAGLRTRSTSKPGEVLSPREIEVLGLIACGYKNQDISKALFIADSTTKIHVRHIFEKLGVRTRSEAVARFQMFAG